MAKNYQAKRYILAMPEADTVIFEGDYVKYFAGTPYIAIFEDYPAASTRIWICKATDGNAASDKRIRILAVRQPRNETKKVGSYVKLYEVQTEAEVNEKVEQYEQGDQIFQQILGGIT